MSAVRPRARCRDEIVEALFTLRAALHRARDSVVVNAQACAKVKAVWQDRKRRASTLNGTVRLFNDEKNVL